MNNIHIISQIINGLGVLINMIGINIKTKSRTLLFFIIGNTCGAIALGLLNATAGMLVQIIFVLETIINFFLEKKNLKFPKWLVLPYIFIPCCVLTITFSSYWDFLPILAGILFPLAIISKNFVLRLLNLIAVMSWIPYCLHFGQYVGAIGSSILSIMNIVSIIRFDVLKKKLDFHNQ